MDNLTHSLVGALLGQAGLKRRTGLAMPALIVGANLPDVDAACFFWLDGVEHLGFRRGIAHGPPALVLLPLILAGALWAWDRGQAARGTRPEGRQPVRFGWLFALAFLACLTHPALDWLNVYGIRLLEPFSSRWFYGDTLFIIDVWLWLGMGLAMWFSLRRETRSGNWRRPALIALTTSLVYINANLLLSRHVTFVARSTVPYLTKAIALPLPGAFWARDVIYQENSVVEVGWVSRRWSLFGGWQGGAEPLLSAGPSCLLPAQLLRFAPRHSGLRAFLFWSRAPYVVPARAGGPATLRDARFSGVAGDRFALRVPVPPASENCGFE